MADPELRKSDPRSAPRVHKKPEPDKSLPDAATNPSACNLTPQEAGPPSVAATRDSLGSTAETSSPLPSEPKAPGNMAGASVVAAATVPSSAGSVDTSGPSPYGTRSRNRTGNARPNYAEDRDTDADSEWNSNRKGNAMSQASAKPVNADKTNALTRRSAPGPTAHGPREQIPGTSSFAVAEGGPGSRSKKRKSPGASTTVAAVTAQAPATSTRKSSQVAAAASTATSYTNTFSFDDTKTCLVDGHLVADDKTTFAPNGSYSFPMDLQINAKLWGQRANDAQTSCTWSASRLASHTTSVGSWSSCTRTTTPRSPSKLSAVTGSTAPATLDVRRLTRACSLHRCTRKPHP